jgi:hypothetical protein
MLDNNLARLGSPKHFSNVNKGSKNTRCCVPVDLKSPGWFEPMLEPQSVSEYLAEIGLVIYLIPQEFERD